MKFDYTIDNYEVGELENIFDLPQGYNRDIISTNEIKLRNSIMADDTIDYTVKMQTLNFLNDAKTILLENIGQPTLAVAEIKEKAPITNVPKYIVTHPDEYFPIKPNPVQKGTRTINVSIDTKFRENYYVTQATDFNIVLPIKLNSVISMQLGAIEMPSTAYFAITQSQGNNFLWLSVDQQILPDPSGNPYTYPAYSNSITLPDGNFTGNEAISQMNKYLQNIPVNYPTQPDNLLQYVRFTVTSSDGTTSGSNGSNQLLAYINLADTPANPGWNTGIYGPTNPRPLFNFIIDSQADLAGNADYYTPLPLKLGWSLGYRNGFYVNNSAYISEGSVNLNGPNYFYICVDDYNNSNDVIYAVLTDSILSKNILARSAIQSSSGGAVGYSNIGLTASPRTYPGPVSIERLHIKIIDGYGRNLNLLNMDFSFVLTFTMNVGDGP